jgi:DNA-binding NtrC family response regulator
MKKKVFILEDSSERIKWFLTFFEDCDVEYSDNVKKSCKKIESEKYDIIFLDRDLAQSKKSGEDVAKYMMENKLSPNVPIVIHSINTIGQKVMKDYLESYHKKVYQIDFRTLMKMKRSDFSF